MSLRERHLWIAIIVTVGVWGLYGWRLVSHVAAGGSTLRDFANAEGGQGYFQHRFDVYGREGKPCLGDGCTGVVKRIVQGGRSTFYCPSCQKR